MKNKKLLFVLVPLVIVIWGLIIMKVVKGTGGEEYNIPSMNYSTSESLTEPSLDTFSLFSNYEDPFSVSKRRKVVPQRTITKEKSTDKNKKTEEVEKWPIIKYSGIIKNKKSKDKVGLLKINGLDHLVQEREKLEELKVVRITTDSIVLQQGVNRKAFYL